MKNENVRHLEHVEVGINFFLWPAADLPVLEMLSRRSLTEQKEILRILDFLQVARCLLFFFVSLFFIGHERNKGKKIIAKQSRSLHFFIYARRARPP